MNNQKEILQQKITANEDLVKKLLEKREKLDEQLKSLGFKISNQKNTLLNLERIEEKTRKSE